MPWKVRSLMSSKKEFILLALSCQGNVSELCRRFGISRKTAYKWINRYATEGEAGLLERSRKPLSSPNATSLDSQEAIFEIRKVVPAWGGRKIRALLDRFGFDPVPAKSTINSILKRNGYIDPKESDKHTKWQYFEAPAPNELWQMDFKGYFDTAKQRCHPLTVLDDHSRFSVCLKACANETTETVKEALTDTFRTYGLPRQMICDNGPPWGTTDNKNPYTRLIVWMIRMGIAVSHSRPRHPQTLGKDERFHRTLKAELLNYLGEHGLKDCQISFDSWRHQYNTERPHEALDMDVPASRYTISPRRFPETLPEIEYGPIDQVRKVQDGGYISIHSRIYQVSRAFYGERVALRPTPIDGVFDVFFCNRRIRQIDLTKPESI
jgi:transposase InsO family protein